MSEASPTAARILEAAMAAIERCGEAGLRLDDIALAAEVTKPAIYYFYDGRDGLVAAAQAERFRRSILNGLADAVEMTRAATSRAEFEALIPGFVDVVFEPEGPFRRAQRIQMLGSAVPRPELTEAVTAALRSAVELTAEVIRTATDRGWATPAFDADVIALWWLSNTHGRHLFDLIADERMDQQWREVTVAQLRSLLFGRD
jgi:AcrR family transcriptional regulator